MTYFLILFLIAFCIIFPILLHKSFPIDPNIKVFEEEIKRLNEEDEKLNGIKTLHFGPIKMRFRK